MTDEALKARRAYNIQYKREQLKRVPFEVKREYYDNVLKPAADRAGEPVNTFIKKAIENRINEQ